MKNKEDKNIEKLVEIMMKETSLEKPPFDFTSRIMSEASMIGKKKSFSYKPVISKSAWVIIFAAIASFIAWFISNGYTQNETSTNAYFSFIKADNIVKELSSFQFSNITINIILVAMIMMFIQIILLKSYLNKRFNK